MNGGPSPAMDPAQVLAELERRAGGRELVPVVLTDERGEPLGLALLLPGLRSDQRRLAAQGLQGTAPANAGAGRRLAPEPTSPDRQWLPAGECCQVTVEERLELFRYLDKE